MRFATRIVLLLLGAGIFAAAATAEKPKDAAKPAPKPLGSMDVRALYEAVRGARWDRAAYEKLLDLVPELLKSKTFDGEDAYYAGMLWVERHQESGKDPTVEMTEAAKHLEVYLGSPGLHVNGASAKANIILAYTSLKRFDEAVTRYEEYAKRYVHDGSGTGDRYRDFEFASSELVNALTEAGQWPRLERVERLWLTYWDFRRANVNDQLAKSASALIDALEAQKKTDEVAKVRENVSRQFHDGEQMTAWVDLIRTIRRVEELEPSDPPAALKVLEAAKDLYTKAELGFAYDTTFNRLSLYGQPARRLEGDAWVNSEPLTLTGLRGKVIVLDFWMTGCGPCQDSFPTMEAFAKKHAEKGVVLIDVTKNLESVCGEDGKEGRWLTWEEGLPRIEKFVKDFKITVPVAIGRVPTDAKGNYQEAAMLRDYGVDFFPAVVVIDRKGIVRFLGLLEEKALAELVTKLEAEPES